MGGKGSADIISVAQWCLLKNDTEHCMYIVSMLIWWTWIGNNIVLIWNILIVFLQFFSFLLTQSKYCFKSASLLSAIWHYLSSIWCWASTEEFFYWSWQHAAVGNYALRANNNNKKVVAKQESESQMSCRFRWKCYSSSSEWPLTGCCHRAFDRLLLWRKHRLYSHWKLFIIAGGTFVWSFFIAMSTQTGPFKVNFAIHTGSRCIAVCVFLL